MFRQITPEMWAHVAHLMIAINLCMISWWRRVAWTLGLAAQLVLFGLAGDPVSAVGAVAYLVQFVMTRGETWRIVPFRRGCKIHAGSCCLHRAPAVVEVRE